MAGKTVNNTNWDLKIAVLVPSTGTWNANTAECVSNLMACFSDSKYENGTKEIKLFGVQCSIIPDSRHRLVAMAHRWGATHALFIDSDMVLPFDTVQTLLNHNQPVVAANCVRRRLPTYPTAFKKRPPKNPPQGGNVGLIDKLGHKPEDFAGRGESGYVYSTEDKHGLEEVDQVGCAVMMIDMRVFGLPELDLPWFAFEPDPEKIPGVIGEDVFFCRKLKKLGVPIYIDHDLSRQVKHMGDMGYSMSMATMSESFYEKLEKDAELHVMYPNPENDKSSLIMIPEIQDPETARLTMQAADWNGVCVNLENPPDGWETIGKAEDFLKLYTSQHHYLFIGENFTPGLDWAKRLVKYCGPWDVVYGPDNIHNATLPAQPCIGGKLMRAVGPLFARGRWFFAHALQDIGEELGTLKYALDGWGDLREQKGDWERIASKSGQIAEYMEWKENEFPSLMEKVKKQMSEYYAPQTEAA